MGKCCVAGCGEIEVDYKSKTMRSKGYVLKQGDVITLDGSTGEVFKGEVKTIEPEVSGAFERIMKVADKIRAVPISRRDPRDSKSPHMAQAVVDPEELRQFAQSLKKFNANLRERGASLGNQLAALSGTWRDQEHKKFAEQFDANMKVLLRFTETADQYVPYLLRKAQHIEDYLQS